VKTEIENWWKQALRDLDAAEKNLGLQEWYITSFMSQQAAEKVLKDL